MPRKPWARRKQTVVGVAVLALLALIAGAWFLTASRVIKVWVYTDYSLRQNRQDWSGLLEARFEEVNRIYRREGTRVRWKVLDSTQVDPTSKISGIDNRRANMALHLDRPTDVFVIFTGIQQGHRTGSANPFTRVACVVDFPDKSEAVNSRLLAHELALLFGVPRDPGWFEALMGEKPESKQLSPSEVAIILSMRNYPFERGIDALSDRSWEKQALAAVSADGTPMAHANVSGHAHTVLGTALINERKFDQALPHFRAAVDADPQNEVTHLNLAEAYARNSQFDKSMVQAREAVRLAPNDPLAHRALGTALGRVSQPEAALDEFQTAARLEPNNVQNHVLLGFEYASMFGHLDDAVAALQEATRVDPNLSIARTGLQKAEDLKQHIETALETQRALVHDHPDDPDAHYRLAKLEARAGDLNSAIRDMQRAAELRPNSAAPHTELAEFYLVSGDTGTAWVEIRKVRALGIEPPAALIARLPAEK